MSGSGTGFTQERGVFVLIIVFPSNEVILFNMLQTVNDNLRKVNFGNKYTKYTKVLPLSSAFTKVALR